MSLNGHDVGKFEDALSNSEEFSPQVLTVSQMTNENTGSSQGYTIDDAVDSCEQSCSANDTATLLTIDEAVESCEQSCADNVTTTPLTIDDDAVKFCEQSFAVKNTATPLDQIIESVETFAGIREDTLLKIVRLLGHELRSEIKSEANYFRSKKSREEEETLLKTPAEILSTEYKCEKLHLFFESVTGKSGRNPGPQQHKIACIQANFYECCLKGANLHTLGPYGLSKS